MQLKNEKQRRNMRSVSNTWSRADVMRALKAGDSLDDAALRRVFNVADPELNTELKAQMNEVMSDNEKAKKFAETFFEQINTDEEPYDRIGHYMAKAICANSVEGLLIAICGWSAPTLVRLANEETLR